MSEGDNFNLCSMKNFTIILLLFSQTTTPYPPKDSLLNALSDAIKNGSNLEVANTYKELAKLSYFNFFEYDTTLKYGKQAIPLYKELEQPLDVAYIYKLLGYAFVDRENYDQGIVYLDSALNIYKDDSLLLPLIQIYTNKGIAYSFVGNNEKSIKTFEKAVKLSKELDDSSQLANNLLNLGIMFSSSGEYPLAIEHLINACNIFEKINDSVTIVNTYLEIGDVYQAWDKNDIAYRYYLKANKLKDKIKDKKVLVSLYDALGYSSQKQDSIHNAEVFYNEVLNLSKEITYKAGISQAYYRLGNLRRYQNELNSALDYYKFSLDIEKEIGSLQGIVYMKNLIASTYNQNGQFTNSLSLLRKARRICLENNFRKNLSENNLMLYKTFKEKGLSDSALFYYEKYIVLRDSIYGEKQELLMEEMREKYESEKNENTILNLIIDKQAQEKQIVRKNQLIGAIVVVFVMLVIILFLFYLQLKHKEENKILHLKQQLFRSQMNPHFIFNALNSIKYFMLDNEKQRAGNYLTDFSQLMRQVLEGSVYDLETLDSEISLVKNYLNLQQLRYNFTFNYEFRIDEDISSDKVLFPTMLLQPFIENSVEHGVSGGANKILIDIFRELRVLKVKIEDNGPGCCSSGNKKHNEHRSRALEITKERIKILKKLYKWKVDFTINDFKESVPQGTIIYFSLPYKESDK